MNLALSVASTMGADAGTPAGAAGVGGVGERWAADWLQRERGFVVVARNWRNPRDRRDDGIRGGPRFPEQWMIVWGIVDTTGNAADFPIADETAERHPHGTRIA